MESTCFAAMHGVGFQWIRRAFEVFKHPSVVPVDLQVEPDPEFSTVTFPNPEEKGVSIVLRDSPRAYRIIHKNSFFRLSIDFRFSIFSF